MGGRRPGNYAGTYTDGTFFRAFSDSTVSATVNGRFTSSGSASGTLSVGIDFSDGTDCTSSGTWSGPRLNLLTPASRRSSSWSWASSPSWSEP
jgi:hypothetical protein